MADAPADDQLLGVTWEDGLWLQNFPLNRETVLDYFSNSQFYDRTCINEQVKMQRNLTPAQAAEVARKMHGVEYQLHHVQEVPPANGSTAHSLYVIVKVERPKPAAAGGKEVARRAYYVLDGVVYEAPTAESVLRARLRRLSWLLESAFAEVCPKVEETAPPSM
ncbi:hypothetical protein AB1Y20_016652 [Prymnesium parvum]